MVQLRVIIILLIFVNVILANIVTQKVWRSGYSLITFLNKQHIPKDIYFNLSKTDKELCSEIQAGITYEIVFSDKNVLEQVLIPISEEMQIHIYLKQNKYILEIIPIISQTIHSILSFNLKLSPYQDIINKTHNKKLANEFVRAFKKSINFKKLQIDDKIVIKYIQKIRLGKYFGTPQLLAASIKMKYRTKYKAKYRTKYIFQNPADGRYYDIKGRSLTSVFFRVPLRYRRISSPFTYKRFHPILKRYIAHLGIDYAAARGTIVRATASGKMFFRGRKGGYGNAIMIRHSGGYKSLYAHLSRFNKHLHKNQWVKQGTIIGYVGTTGRSTGPHLHFGLYKNGRAVNPAKVFRYSKKTLYGKSRRKYLSFVKKVKKELDNAAKGNLKQFEYKPFKLSYNIDTNQTSFNKGE